jgi:hypothetical protein
MRTYYVGLDAHSKRNAFLIEDEGGKVVAQGEVGPEPPSWPTTSVDWGSIRSWSGRTRCGSRHTGPRSSLRSLCDRGVLRP